MLVFKDCTRRLRRHGSPLARSRIPHAWARVRFFAITSWITREFRFEERLFEFPYAVALAIGPFLSKEPFDSPRVGLEEAFRRRESCSSRLFRCRTQHPSSTP